MKQAARLMTSMGSVFRCRRFPVVCMVVSLRYAVIRVLGVVGSIRHCGTSFSVARGRDYCVGNNTVMEKITFHARARRPREGCIAG